MSETDDLLDEIEFLRTALYNFINDAQGNLQDSYVLSVCRIINKDIAEYIKQIYRLC